jgi:tetratricopeptide (TPR) repeat protein
MGFRWYDSAKVALHNWTEVEPSVSSYFPQMYGWLHALHLRSGEIPEARKWKDKFDIACADSGVGAIAFTLGACYADAGLMSRGDSLMRLAISLDNNNPAYREKYGSVLLQYGDIDNALQQLTFAARLTTPSKGLMLKLGNIFKLKGDTSKALEYYNRFLDRDSISYDSKQVHKWIAEIHREP